MSEYAAPSMGALPFILNELERQWFKTTNPDIIQTLWRPPQRKATMSILYRVESIGAVNPDSTRAGFDFIPPDPQTGAGVKPDPAGDLLAEMKCLRCKKIFWIDFAKRHAGRQRVIPGVEQVVSARCPTCKSGEDWAEYTGRSKAK